MVAASLLLVTACTSDDPVQEREAVPGHDELTAAIAEFGEPFYDFDELRAVMVADEADVVFEEYYETDEDAHWGMQSVTKSVIGTLVGIAVDEGLIGSIDDTVGEMLPRYAGVMSARTADITISQLLTMTAGLPGGLDAAGPDFLRSEDWVRHIVTHPDLPPGQQFQYSDASSHLLSAILSEATGEPALQYARSRLFDPLGI
ncbi:MAG TPA: serine hydrolase, partial [Nocardioides sp.]|nr:serine hydrolase [Nocardioides sp.]